MSTLLESRTASVDGEVDVRDDKVEAVEPQRSLAYRVYKASRFWVILALIVGAVLLSGLSASVVKTGSMRPTFQPGDLVVTVNPDIVKPAVGKVVVATPEVAGKELPAIAHRVISVGPDGSFKTKGDFNPEPDAWHDRPADIDKVVVAAVPMGWVRNPMVIAGGIGVLALIFMWPSSKRAEKDAAESVEKSTHGAGPDGDE